MSEAAEMESIDRDVTSGLLPRNPHTTSAATYDECIHDFTFISHQFISMKSSGCGLRWRFTRHWRNLTSVTPVQCGWNLPSANPTTLLFGKYHGLRGFARPQLRSSVHVGTNFVYGAISFLAMVIL